MTEHGSVSRETVRRRLGEKEIKPWQRKMWCIPKIDAEYVARMEDVLELYAEPPDPARPVVCFDESPTQMIGESRTPIPAKPGARAKIDYEYRRNGTANLFVFLDAHQPWRHVKVTDRRTAIDYARCMRDLVDLHYPQAEKIESYKTTCLLISLGRFINFTISPANRCIVHFARPTGGFVQATATNKASSLLLSFRRAPGLDSSLSASSRLLSTNRCLIRYTVEVPTEMVRAISRSLAPPSDASSTCARFTFRTCVLPLDGSARARGMFDAATELARGLHARLVLYRALVIPPDYTPAGATEADPLPAFLEREARAQLTALSELAPDIACELRVEAGVQPWRSILAAADAVKADLIALGSHGYHGWDYVLGATAGEVANVAHRSVLVIHEAPGAALKP